MNNNKLLMEKGLDQQNAAIQQRAVKHTQVINIIDF